MKKVFSMMCMFMTCIGYTLADEIVVPNVIIPQGGIATLDIQLNNEQVLSPNFEFYLRLPDGVTVVNDSEKLGERFNGTGVTVSCTPNEGRYWILAMLLPPSNAPIPDESGTIVTLDLLADESLKEGATLDASIEDITFNTWFVDKSGVNAGLPSPVDFTITITEATDGRTILDENSTSAPIAANGVDIRVLRTIKANEWSTICLPFAMNEAQVKAAFGDDVELADFNDYEHDETKETINVKFQNVTAIAANHPYIIKVNKNVSEFTANDVDIYPEDEPIINFGTKRKPHAIVGTYVANTVIDNGCLFLSGNKFWYSVGTTKMKAFRAYFNFNDLLPDFEENYAEARVYMVFADDETTGVAGIKNGKWTIDNSVYDLQGRKVQKPSKGLYIKNGRKEVVK